MKIKDLKNKSQKELDDLLLDLRKKFNQARFDLNIGKLKQTHTLGQFKKDIARIMTLRNELAK